MGLCEDMGIPTCIKHCGVNGEVVKQGFVSEEEFLSRVDSIAENAFNDACTLSNPRKTSKEDLVEILKWCYYGKKVEI